MRDAQAKDNFMDKNRVANELIRIDNEFYQIIFLVEYIISPLFALEKIQEPGTLFIGSIRHYIANKTNDSNISVSTTIHSFCTSTYNLLKLLSDIIIKFVLSLYT